MNKTDETIERIQVRAAIETMRRARQPDLLDLAALAALAQRIDAENGTLADIIDNRTGEVIA